MWLVLGTKEHTERVPNGRQVERLCSECHETAMFYERRATSTIQLYFIDVVDYRSRTVMACGACGALYATDDVETRQPTALEKLTGAAEQVGSTIASGAARAFEKVSDAARGALQPDAPEARRPARPSATDDPLADEDAALEARFEELEKRARVRISE
jgi:ABC-type nitrate/sulfonate/bicarbonate transport system substrate-binding protein